MANAAWYQPSRHTKVTTWRPQENLPCVRNTSKCYHFSLRLADRDGKLKNNWQQGWTWLESRRLAEERQNNLSMWRKHSLLSSWGAVWEAEGASGTGFWGHKGGLDYISVHCCLLAGRAQVSHVIREQPSGHWNKDDGCVRSWQVVRVSRIGWEKSHEDTGSNNVTEGLQATATHKPTFQSQHHFSTGAGLVIGHSILFSSSKVSLFQIREAGRTLMTG